MKKTKKESLFNEDQIKDWSSRYDKNFVELFVEVWDTEKLDKDIDMFLNNLLQGNSFDQSFLQADLERRQNEAKMVGEEVRMFSATANLLEQSVGMRNKLGDKLTTKDSVSALTAVNDGINSAANLVNALAKKNRTMGSGVPESPGSTIPRNPIPEEPISPEIEKPKPPKSKACYEQYKDQIRDLYDKNITSWYNFELVRWKIIVELTLCGGPAVARLLIEMLGAAKGK